MPDQAAREKILRVLISGMRLDGRGGQGPDLALIAKRTPGFVGADLMSLAKEAGMLAVKRLADKLDLLPPVALLGDPAGGPAGGPGARGAGGVEEELDGPGEVARGHGHDARGAVQVPVHRLGRQPRRREGRPDGRLPRQLRAVVRGGGREREIEHRRAVEG